MTATPQCLVCGGYHFPSQPCYANLTKIVPEQYDPTFVDRFIAKISKVTG